MIPDTLLAYDQDFLMPGIERFDALFSDDRIVFITDTHPFSPLPKFKYPIAISHETKSPR